MNQIKFDISCFKHEFQEYIFKKVDCLDYFEFINKYENSFSLNIPIIYPKNIIQEDESCTYKSINSDIQSEVIEQNVEKNIDKIISEINSDESDEEEDEEEKIDIKFNHIFENNEIHVFPNKKFIPKRLGKIIKKNNGYWVKQKNMWIFPLSSKQFIENTLQSSKNTQDKVIIHPKPDHPKYGLSTIYDKSGNLGVWDQSIKGWVFQKKN